MKVKFVEAGTRLTSDVSCKVNWIIAGLDESLVGIKLVERNFNNLRYADDTIQMAESEEELKSFLMRVKEESEKVALKLDMKKGSWQLVPSLNGKSKGKIENSDRFYFLGLQDHCEPWLQPWNWKDTCSLEGKLWQT